MVADPQNWSSAGVASWPWSRGWRWPCHRPIRAWSGSCPEGPGQVGRQASSGYAEVATEAPPAAGTAMDTDRGRLWGTPPVPGDRRRAYFSTTAVGPAGPRRADAYHAWRNGQTPAWTTAATNRQPWPARSRYPRQPGGYASRPQGIFVPLGRPASPGLMRV